MQDRDLVIVGAGPIGIELAVACRRAGLDACCLEAGPIGATIWGLWPRQTHFLSSPEAISIAGVPLESPDQERPTGETYLGYLRSVVRQFQLDVRTFTRVERIEPISGGGGFRLTLRGLEGGGQVLRCRRCVLATGDMARPRRLEVPGADRSHVHFGYVDPHLYAGRRVLVVGGRNSALEAVLRLRRVGAEVTLCYRRDRIDRERNSHKLAPLVCDAIDAGELPFLPRRVPVGFEGGAALLGPTDEAGLPTAGTVERVETDFAVVLIGFEADLSLMVQAGVQIDEEGRPAFDEKTQRTGVPGLYIAGTAVAGDGYGHPHFIETCHVHVDRILADLRS